MSSLQNDDAWNIDCFACDNGSAFEDSSEQESCNTADLCNQCTQFFDIQKTFKESIEQLETNYTKTIEVLRSQLEKKFQELRKLHVSLRREKENVRAERARWESEKRQQNAKYKIQDESDIVHLNVGGTHSISCAKDLLQSIEDSALQAMFSGRHNLVPIELPEGAVAQASDQQQRFFIDRDGEVFSHLINYLRNNRHEKPVFQNENMAKLFLEELDFWGVETFEQQEELKLMQSIPSDLRKIFETMPPINSPSVKQIWQELGPINLAEVHKHCSEDSLCMNMQIDLSLKISKGTTQKGNIYEGQIGKDGKPEGLYRFVVRNPETIFEGQWLKNGSHGYGRIIWNDGKYYIGHWKDAKLHGYGKLVSKFQQIIKEGKWDKDQFVGQ